MLTAQTQRGSSDMRCRCRHRRGALAAVDRFVARIEGLTALISGFGIFGLMLIGVVHVFGRKFFNMPIFGYIDIVEIMMSFLVFLGLAYTERLGGHIRMELFVTNLKGRWLAMFELLRGARWPR